LLEHGYVMESVDKTLFTLNHDNDFSLVQIYVDDIIFGGYSHTLVSGFQEMMENEFQMSMMGKLTFFLGIQVKQMKQGMFVHQAKYKKDPMKKFNMAKLKPVSTPMNMATSLDLDENGEATDQREYRSMIGPPPIPHGDTARHSVHHVPVYALSGFPTLFTSDCHSVNIQASQTYS
jgi:hypothetical protein